MKLEISHFKKIKEDENSAILRHPKGHEIRIAKKSLQPHLKKQLENLPHFDQGGELQQSDVDKMTPDQLMNKLHETRENIEHIDNAEGEEKNDNLDRKLVAPNEIGLKNNMYRKQQGNAAMYTASNGGKIPANKSLEQDTKHKGSQYKQPDPNMVYANEGTEIEQPEDQMNRMPAESAPQNVALPPAAKPQEQSQPPMMQNVVPQLKNAYEKVAKGQEKEAETTGKVSEALQAPYEELIGESSDLQKMSSDMNNRMLGDIDEQVNQMKTGMIHPNQYLENMSVPQKIATAIGLIAGGIGGGLTHQENPAAKFLNEQINRDVEAQKANLGQGNTLLEMNIKKYGSYMAGLNVTNAILKEKQAMEMVNMAQQAKSPIEQQRLMNAANQTRVEAIQKIAPLAQQQAMFEFITKHPNMEPSLKVRAMSAAGMMPEQDAKSIYGEIEKAKQIEQLRQDSKQTYNNINDLWGRGLMSPARRSAERDLLAGKIQKASEGRYNFEASQQIADSMYPARAEGADTTRAKLGLIDKFYDSFRNESVGPAYGITIPKGHVSTTHRNKQAGPNYPKKGE